MEYTGSFYVRKFCFTKIHELITINTRLSMNLKNNWQEDTLEAIQQQRAMLEVKAQKKYQVDLLERVVRRVSDFSISCDECLSLQAGITELVSGLNGQDASETDGLKAFRKKLRHLTGHLHKKHRLRPSGSMTAIGITLGTAVGISLGNGMSNIGAGIALGTGIGIALGAGLEARAKREGRTI